MKKNIKLLIRKYMDKYFQWEENDIQRQYGEYVPAEPNLGFAQGYFILDNSWGYKEYLKTDKWDEFFGWVWNEFCKLYDISDDHCDSIEIAVKNYIKGN